MIETDDLAFITGERERFKENLRVRWTKAEDDKLWNLIFVRKMSRVDAAKQFDRTPTAIKERWQVLRRRRKPEIQAAERKKDGGQPVTAKTNKFCHSMKPPESVYLGYLR